MIISMYMKANEPLSICENNSTAVHVTLGKSFSLLRVSVSPSVKQVNNYALATLALVLN